MKSTFLKKLGEGGGGVSFFSKVVEIFVANVTLKVVIIFMVEGKGGGGNSTLGRPPKNSL